MKMNLLHLPQVDSTNLYLKQNDLPLGTVLYTQNQTAGRGRLGRTWQSGGGVAISVLVPAGNPQLPLIASIAAARALQALLGLPMQIKWPNDILCGGKKLCGILCEGTPTKSVAGFGINLTQSASYFANLDLPYATSAALLGAEPPTPESVAMAVGATLLELLPRGFFPLWEEYRTLSATLGQTVRIIKGTQSKIGTALDVTENGSLLIDFGQGPEEVFSGEVSVRGIYGEAIV